MKAARQWYRAMKVFGQCDNLDRKHPENSRRSQTRYQRFHRIVRQCPPDALLRANFGRWKEEVIRLARALYWAPRAIASIPWDEFREQYFDGDEYRSPKETWFEEYSYL